jgi:DNA-binding NarL/FixJ family response regulator
MPPSGTDEGIRFARRLRETDPDIGVVVLSQFAEGRYVIPLLESGSAGRAYLLKERVRHPDQLLAAIDAVNASDSLIDPTVVDVLIAAKSRAEQSPLSELTPRELDVLAAIAEGKSNSAIAQTLSLTKRAVEKHVNSIFAKLKLGSSGELSPRVTAALMFLAESPSEAAKRLADPLA